MSSAVRGREGLLHRVLGLRGVGEHVAAEGEHPGHVALVEHLERARVALPRARPRDRRRPAAQEALGRPQRASGSRRDRCPVHGPTVVPERPGAVEVRRKLANLALTARAFHAQATKERISHVKRSFAAVAALGAVRRPATAGAKPTGADRTNAAKECRAERGDTDATREAFRVEYGTNKNGKNAFGKCVSRRSKSEERQREGRRSQRRQGVQGRARGRPGGVRREVRHQQEQAATPTASASPARPRPRRTRPTRATPRRPRRAKAAKDCAAERETLGREAFAEKYGTNENKRNAFGKCVSKKAQTVLTARGPCAP